MEVRKIELIFAPEVDAKDRPAVVGAQTKVEFDRTTLHHEQETRRVNPFPALFSARASYIAAPKVAAPAKSGLICEPSPYPLPCEGRGETHSPVTGARLALHFPHLRDGFQVRGSTTLKTPGRNTRRPEAYHELA